MRPVKIYKVILSRDKIQTTSNMMLLMEQWGNKDSARSLQFRAPWGIIGQLWPGEWCWQSESRSDIVSKNASITTLRGRVCCQIFSACLSRGVWTQLRPGDGNFAQDIPRLTVNFCQALTGDYTPVNKPLVPLTLGSSGCSKISLFWWCWFHNLLPSQLHWSIEDTCWSCCCI